MKNDWYVCEWDKFGGFWLRITGPFIGHYAKQNAEDLAKHWGTGYQAKNARHSVSQI